MDRRITAALLERGPLARADLRRVLEGRQWPLRTPRPLARIVAIIDAMSVGRAMTTLTAGSSRKPRE